MDMSLLVITGGAFLASVVNAAFATGGVYILLASSSAVLPLSAAIPLQSAFAFSSLAARIWFFWSHIRWPFVAVVMAGGSIGVLVGVRIFVTLPETFIALSLGIVLLALIWVPAFPWKPKIKHPFFFVGLGHGFLATIFGVGALLQPAILRTEFLKLQITGTLAACLVLLDIVKIASYTQFGFNYLDYVPHIICATLAGFLGTWVGKRMGHFVSETQFRIIFKILITLVALRLIYRGLANL